MIIRGFEKQVLFLLPEHSKVKTGSFRLILPKYSTNHFLRNTRGVIFTESPLEALFLIQNDYPNTIFLFGDDHKYVKFINEHRIKRVIFTFEGKMRLFYKLSKNGVSTKRVFIDFNKIKNAGVKENLEKISKLCPNKARLLPPLRGEEGMDRVCHPLYTIAVGGSKTKRCTGSFSGRCYQRNL